MTASRREEGAALLIAIIAMLLLSALGAALILNSSSETMIAAHFRDGLEARYAAGALIERGVDDISGTADWTLLTGGVLRSSWVDGPPSGSRALADGSTIDLAQAVNLANCGKTAVCTAADLIAVTSDRPWGANNPQWWPYAYGPLRNLLGQIYLGLGQREQSLREFEEAIRLAPGRADFRANVSQLKNQ